MSSSDEYVYISAFLKRLGKKALLLKQPGSGKECWVPYQLLAELSLSRINSMMAGPGGLQGGVTRIGIVRWKAEALGLVPPGRAPKKPKEEEEVIE